MTTICLVACTSKKALYPSLARDLYKSPLFEGSKWYAEKKADDWFILSAKHGLLSPTEGVEPYDESLHSMDDEGRKRWARRVYKQIKKVAASGTRIIFLAGDKYRKYLEIHLREDGYLTAAPMSELGIGRQVAWLQKLANEEARLDDLGRFYSLLNRIASANGVGWRRLGECGGKSIPERGIYFFREAGEYRMSAPFDWRTTRIGTHAVSSGSKATLWNRLRTHRGGAHGSGNHRGSIFRLHVGQALLRKTERDAELPTWGIGQTAEATTKANEVSHELEVSKVIGQMEILCLEVNDAASADSDRAYLERNAIALLAGPTGPIDMPSKNWLGLYSSRGAVGFSGLWNVNHVYEEYDPSFLEVLEQYVELTESGVPQPSISLAPAKWRQKITKVRLIKQQMELV